MKTISAMIAFGIIVTIPAWAHAEARIVTLKKVEKDLYQTNDGAFIETSGCYVEANEEPAVLNYEKYACNNTIRFGTKKTCEVVSVF